MNIEIEEVFSSRGRIKIIKELMNNKDGMLITELCKRVGLNHGTVTAHLKALRQSGLVGIHGFGRIKLIYLIVDDKRTDALRYLITVWDE